MIDLKSERTVPLNKAPQFVPGHPHLSTIWRWYLRGVRGVKLETLVVGGRRFTSVEAIERFCERLSRPAAVRGALHAEATTSTAVEKELDRARI